MGGERCVINQMVLCREGVATPAGDGSPSVLLRTLWKHHLQIHSCCLHLLYHEVKTRCPEGLGRQPE